MPPRIILASASPRRRQLLAELGVSFEVIVAQVVEHEEPFTPPKVMVAHNAALKADWVAERNPDAWVLGADTTVFLGDRVLNKPADLDESRRMLASLSGRTHIVFTGLALRHKSARISIDDGDTAEVTFKPFGPEVIESYLLKVNTLDKAGAYSIQEHADMIIAGTRGSLSNIAGLPLETTKHLLRRCGLLGPLPSSPPAS